MESLIWMLDRIATPPVVRSKRSIPGLPSYGAIHASIRCSTSRNLKVSDLSIPMATRG